MPEDVPGLAQVAGDAPWMQGH